MTDFLEITLAWLGGGRSRPDAWRIQGASSIDLHASNKSDIAGQALTYIGQLYEIEREVKSLSAEERQKIRMSGCN